MVVPLEEAEKTGSTDKKNTDFLLNCHILTQNKNREFIYRSASERPHPRIKNAIKDGKRKLYVPIWADLGEYNVLIASGILQALIRLTLR